MCLLYYKTTKELTAHRRYWEVIDQKENIFYSGHLPGALFSFFLFKHLKNAQVSQLDVGLLIFIYIPKVSLDIEYSLYSMHPRNIFKENKPNFQELGKEFPEFLPHVQNGLSGKPYVNFKNPASLRALSKVLLKKYYNIEIEIPLDRLIPTIPLRLNYIHWIEDLLNDGTNPTAGDITGLDVGTYLIFI